MRTLAVGDRVKLTGKFLKNTGQHTSDEGHRVWQVLGFSMGGRLVVVDQVRDDDDGMFTPEELAADPSLKYRRIAVANLYKVGTLDSRNCP